MYPLTYLSTPTTDAYDHQGNTVLHYACLKLGKARSYRMTEAIMSLEAVIKLLLEGR